MGSCGRDNCSVIPPHVHAAGTEASRPPMPFQMVDGVARPVPWDGGIGLRDYFAAAALPKCLEEFWGQSDDFSVNGSRTYAEAAYQIADAMLTTRDEKP